MADCHIVLSNDLDKLDWTEACDLLAEAGLGQPGPEIYEIACRNSYKTVYARRKGQLVGIGRRLSDGVMYNAIFDVAVLPEFQDQGIGRRIMEYLHAQMPGERCLLYSTPGKERFYEKLNYRKCRTGMIRVYNEEGARRAGLID